MEDPSESSDELPIKIEPYSDDFGGSPVNTNNTLLSDELIKIEQTEDSLLVADPLKEVDSIHKPNSKEKRVEPSFYRAFSPPPPKRPGEPSYYHRNLHNICSK